MRTFMLGIIALSIPSTDALAQSDPAKERHELMRTMQDVAYAPLRQMARDQRTYDKAFVEKAYGIMEAGLSKAPNLWPPNSPSDPKGRYVSSPKVWENRADFESKLSGARKLLAGSQVVAITGPDGLKSVAPQLEQACSGCHETYRIRQ